MPSPLRAGGPQAPKTVLADGRVLSFKRSLLMGIVNVTPDSFYGNSRCSGADAAASKAEQMVGAGADILDVGGESTRPGAEFVDAETEMRRVSSAILLPAVVRRTWGPFPRPRLILPRHWRP